MNNNIHMIGKLKSGISFSYESMGEKFYKAYLDIERKSGTFDTIPIILSEWISGIAAIKQGDRVEIHGECRTHNNDHKVKIYVNVDSISKTKDEDCNEVELIGSLCKPPVYRTTPLGREITDICLDVKRRYDKPDFIPCVTWGKSAKKAAEYNTKDVVRLSGRLQSRCYTKDNEQRIAYEVSVISIEEGKDGYL